ncbi:hypothetical protein HBH70_002500 [Parastagonospora nodorum]|nr:hypothetical protein HBH52_151470 [Parastagonospora nodorum]KAH4273539.1 hypothetical protein HBI03_017440 [Parastagonospora nodorum]KAH4283782.1 hypothetical protein HBI04_002530 [Parastagonospora nodorum]KAH4297704.1 hypothetical protein HBI01_137110 [Parastagonospora nodorum]KAH4308819.1 hypothetical protein HBI02_103600 [Parastagonospora nodorum]
MTEPAWTCSFENLIQSDLFTFYVGEERKTFRVHTAAIAATSGPFRALLTGGLAEANQGSAEILDVEPDDFVRFLEYAYRGDYTVPPWTIDESALATSDVDAPEEEPVPDAPTSPTPDDESGSVFAESTDGWEPSVPADHVLPVEKAKQKKERDMLTLRSTFQERSYVTDGAPNAQISESFRPKPNSAVDQDFTTVFLAHTRLYMFAEMRLIYPLRSLTLQKLHKSLIGFQLYNQRVGDVVKLARWAYEHGTDRSKGGAVNELRQLVVEYMACEVDIIGKHKDFKLLLEDGGEFVTDFWGVVSKYLL